MAKYMTDENIPRMTAAFNEQMRFILRAEDVSANIVGEMAQISGTAVNSIFGVGYTNGKTVQLTSVLRILDFLGYDIALIKRAGVKMIKDDPEILIKIKNALHEKNKRSYKPRPKSIKVVVRKSKLRYDERPTGVISKRSEIDATKRKDDFFGDS